MHIFIVGHERFRDANALLSGCRAFPHNYTFIPETATNTKGELLGISREMLGHYTFFRADAKTQRKKKLITLRLSDFALNP